MLVEAGVDVAETPGVGVPGITTRDSCATMRASAPWVRRYPAAYTERIAAELIATIWVVRRRPFGRAGFPFVPDDVLDGALNCCWFIRGRPGGVWPGFESVMRIHPGASPTIRSTDSFKIRT